MVDDEHVLHKSEDEEKADAETQDLGPRTESIVYRNPKAAKSPSQCNLIVPNAIYKVRLSFFHTFIF